MITHNRTSLNFFEESYHLLCFSTNNGDMYFIERRHPNKLTKSFWFITKKDVRSMSPGQIFNAVAAKDPDFTEVSLYYQKKEK